MQVTTETVKSSDCYFELPYQSEFTTKLYLACQMAKDIDWVKYYNFELLYIEQEVLRKVDPFLRQLYKAHRFEAGVVRMQPNTFYDWHVDDNRGVCVNMLINHAQSHCIFRDPKKEGAITGKFHELNYERGVYYFFNNQVEHSIYNFEGTRYLLTLQFAEDKTKLDFHSLVKEWRDGRWRKRKPTKANK